MLARLQANALHTSTKLTCGRHLATMASARRHRIVAVDAWVKPPHFDFDHDLTEYDQTSPEQLPERIKDATIVICSGTYITKQGIESAPNLQFISCNGTGTNTIDKETARERGISVSRVPAQNTDSVSEHAFALYYAIRRHIVELHAITMDGTTWSGNYLLNRKLGQPPRTNAEETLVVIGYGAIGMVSSSNALSHLPVNKQQVRTLKGSVKLWE